MVGLSSDTGRHFSTSFPCNPFFWGLQFEPFLFGEGCSGDGLRLRRGLSKGTGPLLGEGVRTGRPQDSKNSIFFTFIFRKHIIILVKHTLILKNIMMTLIFKKICSPPPAASDCVAGDIGGANIGRGAGGPK